MKLVSNNGWTIYRREAYILSGAIVFVALLALLTGILLGFSIWG